MRCGYYLLLFFSSILLYAQERCGTNTPTNGHFESWIKQEISRKRASHKTDRSPVYQVPVVVHVFHNGESVGTGANLSKERIRAQIDSLSADFRRMNADRINTPAAFEPVAADVEIAFVLAAADPAGKPTDGIVRVLGEKNSFLPSDREDQIRLRSQSFWNPDQYLNIYVASFQGFLGRAIFPETPLPGITFDAEQHYIDGVFIDYEYFGVNPTAPEFESIGRTLTHEVGHFLGLRHIWGDGGCGRDDFVMDTPLADDDNGGYSSPCTFPNPIDDQVCITDEPEMFQNYMDYTDDVCMNLFTQGQSNRMRTVIENSPRRETLRSSPGLMAPALIPNDLAITHVLSPNTGTCQGSIQPTIRVLNVGSNEVTSFAVQFSLNGTPVGPLLEINDPLDLLQSDTVSFPQIGISTTPATLSFKITMVNGDLDGSPQNDQITEHVIQVSSVSFPFEETFEVSNNMFGQFGSESAWEVVNAPSEVVTNEALIFKSHENANWFGDPITIKTPILDLTNLPSGELLFSYAYAPTSGSFFDGLMVKASVDCGETFSEVLFSGFGADLATTGPMDASFKPNSHFEWLDTLVSINQFSQIDGVQFAFIGLSGGGNNIYLDNILVVETNDFLNDVQPIAIADPLVTCSENLETDLRIRNQGISTVKELTIRYVLNDVENFITYNNLNLSSREFTTLNLPLTNIAVGENTLAVTIIEVNGMPDESPQANDLATTFFRDEATDEFPLVVNFERPDEWQPITENTSSIWERTTFNSNTVLTAKGYQNLVLGSEHWFISPELNTGGLDSAFLTFRMSYAERKGFSDRLQVRMSVDCGLTYDILLFDADEDSLSLMSTSQAWVPTDVGDWQTARVSLDQAFFFNDEIRIAFVFTTGGGNNLYIDDIQILENAIPMYEELFLVYPNPASEQFNVGLNFPEKEIAEIRLLDLSGKILYEEKIENALNQILQFKAPMQGGLYLVRVQGKRYSATQKIYIDR